MNIPAFLTGDARSEQRVDMPVSFLISVYSETPRVDVKLTIDNNAKDHRLRLKLMPNIKTGIVRSQSHLAIIDRTVERQKEIEKWIQPVTRLLPFREWLSVEDDKTGLCVAVKGIYDYEAIENQLTGCPEISLTLLRGFGRMGRTHTMQRWGGASPAVETPGAQCPGIQKFEWSFIPFASEANEKAPFLKFAQAFLYPPVSHAVRSKQENNGMKGIEGIAWNEDNIQFSAFKRSLDGIGYVLRVFENQGKSTEVKISIPDFETAFLSDLDEKTGVKLEISKKSISIDVKPYKVVTIKLIK
jgi:alpha-mannosidase